MDDCGKFDTAKEKEDASDWQYGRSSSNRMIRSMGPVSLLDPIPTSSSSSPASATLMALSHHSNAFDMSFIPPNQMIPRMLPQTLSSSPQFPTDSGFIERAARFSCFSGSHFGAVLNSPFSINPESIMNPPHPQETFSAAVFHSGGVLNGNEAYTSPVVMMNEKKSETRMQSSDEVEFSGGREETSGIGEEPSSTISTKVLASSRKRKRIGQENVKETEIQEKGEEQTTPPVSTSNGKQGGSQSDTPKEDYIHVRARRGQATNSHSLAERVRREKISERMKYLQDLVPGCSKVTGKAVMLDEIINYVQSLQRQVEFLSMKLATVNPRLDFNTEELFMKDILHSQVGASTAALGYSSRN